MSYKNKTYVAFDGDNDMWAYAYMLGWNSNRNIDFDFHDAHDLNTITNRSQEDNTKRKLRERFKDAKQFVLLVGDSTKNLYRFVRWEIDVAQQLGLPIVVVSLNKKRSMDYELCPPIIRNKDAMHVAFRMRIIKHALDEYAVNYYRDYVGAKTDWYYKDEVYTDLGL